MNELAACWPCLLKMPRPKAAPAKDTGAADVMSPTTLRTRSGENPTPLTYLSTAVVGVCQLTTFAPVRPVMMVYGITQP